MPSGFTISATGHGVLFLAAVLVSALIGIEDKMVPPAPITGNAYEQKLDHVPTDRAEAINRFAESAIAKRIFVDQLVDIFTRTKRQEHFHFLDLSVEDQLAL